MENGIFTYLIVAGIFIFGFYVLFVFVPFGLWLSAKTFGVKITLLELVYMKIRRIAPAPIVRSLIMAAKADIEIDKDALEAHSLAGGNVENVVDGMVIAKKKDEHLSFQEASKRDLANEDFSQEE